jgi:type IX secretion system PorP/SprF family membrane protein
MRKRNLIILVFICFTFKATSQDIHTTQIAQHDYLYNPGMIGNYHGNSRIQLTSRNQWTNINNAFTTYNAFADFKISPGKWDKGNLGICLAANKDNSGDGFLEKTSFNLGLSSVVKLNENFSLSLGFLNTYSQLNVDASSIKWGSQFNGESHDPNLPSGEQFTQNSLNFFNLASGIVLSYGKEEGYMALYDKTHIQFGLSGFNLLPSKKYSNLLSDSLQQRYCVFAKGLIGIPRTRTGFAGSLLVQRQGPNTEIVFGGYYRIRIKEASKITGFHKESAIGLGGLWRYGDAICPAILFELKDYAIGISYDMTISKLLPATNTMGALEVTFRIQTNNKFLYKGYKP